MEPLRVRLIEPDWTDRVPSPAHDALTADQRRQYLAEFPDSFLGVTRGPGDLPPGMSWTSDQLLAEGRRSFERLVAADAFSPLRPASLYVYRLSINGHVQTAVVGGVTVADYAEGRIRTHENINPDRARHLSRHLDVVACQSSPIALAHRPLPALTGAVHALAANREPELSFVSGDGLQQTLWPVADAEAEHLLALLEPTTLYLIDGHHRAAAAVAHRAEAGPGPADHVLSAVFPAAELRNRAHHRVLEFDGETDDFLEDLQGRLPVRITTDLDEVLSREPEEIALFGSGEWHLVTIPFTATGDSAAARLENLEPVRLQRAVIEPFVIMNGPDANASVSYRPGTEPLDALAAEADRTDGVLCALRPVAIGDLLDASDESLIMPPKSTYFEPKTRSGVFARPMVEV